MKCRIFCAFAVISCTALFGLGNAGGVLVDPGLKDVQQFLKGQYVNVQNPALHHLPTAGPNYITQTTTFVGEPIVVQNEVKVLQSPPPVASSPSTEYGPVDQGSPRSDSGPKPDKISVTILKEFSLGAVPGGKGNSANIQYDIQRENNHGHGHAAAPSLESSYGVPQESGQSQGYQNPPPIQQFIDQHTQQSIGGGGDYAIPQNQPSPNFQDVNQISLQQESSGGYNDQNGQQQSGGGYSEQSNGGYQQQNAGGYDQQPNTGGYQQQQQQNNGGGYQQQQNAGGYQQQQNTGGYQQSQQQNNGGGYQQPQQQNNGGGYQQPQQQQQNNAGGYQQQQNTGGYQQQQNAGGYQQPQQQNNGGGYQQPQQQQQNNAGGYQQPQQQQQNAGGYDQSSNGGGYNGGAAEQQQSNGGGYNNNQLSAVQQQIGGYSNNNQVSSQQQQSSGGYNNNQVTNQQQQSGGYNQQQSTGGYDSSAQQQQNNGVYNSNQQETISGQATIQNAQQTQLVGKNSKDLVKALGFGPVLEQAELIFKSEAPQPPRQEQETIQQESQYGAPNQQSENVNSQYGAPSQQSGNLNSQYGAPSKLSEAPSSSYGTPNQNQQSGNVNSQYGAPSQLSEAPSSQYGAPNQQSEKLNSEYGAPSQNGNGAATRGRMQGWTVIQPQFARSHFAKGGEQGKDNPWTPQLSQMRSNVGQGGYSDNVNQATKDFRVNNLVVDKNGVSQTYNSDQAAKVVIHAQNVIIKSDIPVEKTAIYGSSRDITPILKEQLRSLMTTRGQQQLDGSVRAKTNAFVAIPNYFKPSSKPAPLTNAGNNQYGPPGKLAAAPLGQYGPPSQQQQSGNLNSQYGPPGKLAAAPLGQYGPPSQQQQSGNLNSQYGPPSKLAAAPNGQYGPPRQQYGAPAQVNSGGGGYNLASSIQQASAYSNNNNVPAIPNNNLAAQRIPNDYGAGLQPPIPFTASSNNAPSPPNDYAAGLSAPPPHIGSSASTSSNSYAPPPAVPEKLINSASQNQNRPANPIPIDFAVGLYAPPPTSNRHIPEGKIVGEPYSLQSESNGNFVSPKGKGGSPPRFKSGRPGATRDYGSSVSYFSSTLGKIPTSLSDDNNQQQYGQHQQNGNGDREEAMPTLFGNNEHPFAHLATKPPPPPGFRNFSSNEKYRYKPAKRPQLFSLSLGFGDNKERKRPAKIVQGQQIDLQGIISSGSNTKNNYKFKNGPPKGKSNSHGPESFISFNQGPGGPPNSKQKNPNSGYTIDIPINIGHDPYTRLGRDLFYSVYDMIKKSAPSFQTIASIPKAITSTMNGIKIPPMRLEFYRN